MRWAHFMQRGTHKSPLFDPLSTSHLKQSFCCPQSGKKEGKKLLFVVQFNIHHFCCQSNNTCIWYVGHYKSWNGLNYRESSYVYLKAVLLCAMQWLHTDDSAWTILSLLECNFQCYAQSSRPIKMVTIVFEDQPPLSSGNRVTLHSVTTMKTTMQIRMFTAMENSNPNIWP